jgi:hypothetical protein
MINEFPNLLTTLRKKARFTNIELAEVADVPRSLIPSLQSGKRCVGEYQARKLGAALGLQGKDLEDFVFCAIDRCTEKVLKDLQDYPAPLLNLVALQLRNAGVTPDAMRACSVTVNRSESEAAIVLNDGTRMVIGTKLEVAA